jgi:3-hydroxyisobutyrate dehydrogenase-like beta-hydroxyacid dehydrogenase
MNGEKARVGIVGVGRMGLAMLKHLVKQGYQVTACDTDDKQLAKARDAGAAAVATTAEVARAADFVIVAVGYDEEVRQVVLEVDGLLANLAPGSIIAVSSTAKPDTVKALRPRGTASPFSTRQSAVAASPRMTERCSRSSAASLTWLSADARSTAASAPTMPISARSGTAKSARP